MPRKLGSLIPDRQTTQVCPRGWRIRLRSIDRRAMLALGDQPRAALTTQVYPQPVEGDAEPRMNPDEKIDVGDAPGCASFSARCMTCAASTIIAGSARNAVRGGAFWSCFPLEARIRLFVVALCASQAQDENAELAPGSARLQRRPMRKLYALRSGAKRRQAGRSRSARRLRCKGAP